MYSCVLNIINKFIFSTVFICLIIKILIKHHFFFFCLIDKKVHVMNFMGVIFLLFRNKIHIKINNKFCWSHQPCLRLQNLMFYFFLLNCTRELWNFFKNSITINSDFSLSVYGVQSYKICFLYLFIVSKIILHKGILNGNAFED